MLQSFKSFFGADKSLSKDESLQLIGMIESLETKNCQKIATNHQKVKVKAGESASVHFKVINSSPVDWPADSTIENDCS